jgi:phage-related baseplate assembly protein
MAGAFTAVDLSKLPFPDAVEQLSAEQIVADVLADLRARDPAFTALVESDPAYKLIEAFAYRETLVRQRANEAVKAVTLAYAQGADLDHRASLVNLTRLVLDPGDPNAIPPVPPTYEPDADLRRRVQLAFEGLSTAGPNGGYVFHALGADPDVLDASVASPTPGAVVVSVLSRTGTGAASTLLLDAVSAALNDDDVRPLTDNLTVQSATIVSYTVDAALTLYPGPDSNVVLAEATARVDAYIAASKRLGRDVTRAGLIGAMMVEGVQNIALNQPIADVVIASGEAANCTARTVTVGGTGE